MSTHPLEGVPAPAGAGVAGGQLSVLVNLMWLVPGVVGGSEDSLTHALTAVADEQFEGLDVRLAVLGSFAAAHPELAARFPCEVAEVTGVNKARRVLAEQTWLARRTRASGVDVVHQAGGVAPLVAPARNVLTIQDLQPLDLPANFSRTKRSYIASMVGRSARSAAVVTVPSEFTRSRVVELLGVPTSHVDVVPWFVPSFDPARTEAPDVDVPGVELTRPYFLYPAITYPHKQHRFLLEAFALLARDEPEVCLVLPGGAAQCEQEVLEAIRTLGLGDRVVRLGRIPRDQLETLYRHAQGVVVPSTYEGFGLPALEAQLRGVPVIAADAGSLPEVVAQGDLVGPSDVTGWAGAMQSVLHLSTRERADRTAAGDELAARFTPRRTATGLVAAYRRAAVTRT